MQYLTWQVTDSTCSNENGNVPDGSCLTTSLWWSLFDTRLKSNHSVIIAVVPVMGTIKLHSHSRPCPTLFKIIVCESSSNVLRNGYSICLVLEFIAFRKLLEIINLTVGVSNLSSAGSMMNNITELQTIGTDGVVDLVSKMRSAILHGKCPVLRSHALCRPSLLLLDSFLSHPCYLFLAFLFTHLLSIWIMVSVRSMISAGSSGSTETGGFFFLCYP